MKEGAKKHPHVKVQQINFATHTVGFRALGKGTGVWPRGYNTHPHSCYILKIQQGDSASAFYFKSRSY